MKIKFLKLNLIISLISTNVFATIVENNIEESRYIQNNVSSRVMSSTQAFSKLIEELDKQSVPTRYLKQSLPYIKSIKFVTLQPNVYGIYNTLTKVMTLGEDFISASTGQVKTLSNLTFDQVASVYHEFWHAYRDNIASKSRSPLILTFASQARSLYRSKGSNIHDEAYGLYAEEIVKNYVHFYSLFEKRNMDSRKKLRDNIKLSNIYKSGFNSEIFGYYRTWRGQFKNSTVNLPSRDRLNIEKNLLDSKVSRNYLEAFAENKF